MDSNFGISVLANKLELLKICGQNDFEVVGPGRYPRFFKIVSEEEGSSPWSCPGFHYFLHNPVLFEKTLASTLSMEQLSFLPLSALVGRRYLQDQNPQWNGSH